VKTRRWLIAGLLFAGLWVFVRGAALRPTSLLTTFLVGLAVGLPVAYVFRRLYEEEIDVGQSLGAVPYIVAYVAVFSKEVIVANLDVAYRVLHPTLQLEPQVVLVPLRVETSLGITTIANSITITPGTITLDHDPDENALYVHMIDGRHPDEVVEPIRVWENYALVIFDEERSPDDPPPEIRVHPPDRPPEPKTVTDRDDETITHGRQE
jgi:multicomponent Na+:H+ antiporter subunit E